MSAARGAAAAFVAIHCAAHAKPAPQPPQAGRHAAQLCVATLPAAPQCGPAQVDVGAHGTVRARVDDVVYQLRLRSSQVEVVVMHNTVQIDEFTAAYEWLGSTLQFEDGDRNSRYEIRFTPRKGRSR